MRRGQSVVELALALPVIIGLLALVLEGGLVVSDQVNLEHYAYAGAQWATSQNGLATPSQIQTYIANQMCTGTGSITAAPTIPSSAASGASRFCQKEPPGVPQLDLTTTPKLVDVSWSAVSLGRPGSFPGPVEEVLAAAPTPCPVQKYGLSATMSPTTVWAGGQGGQPGSATITITFDSGSPYGNSSDPWPVVQLSGGPWPPGLTPQTPQITPSQITPAGGGAPSGYANSATVTLNTTNQTLAGDYSFSITGADTSCSTGPGRGSTALTLHVNNTVAASPTVSGPTITGVNPPSVCAATASAIHILGTNFTAGMTVQIGTIPLTNVVVVNGNDISGTTPLLGPGVYNVQVLNQSTGTPLATAAGAITVPASCLAPPPPPPPAVTCGSATVGAGSTTPVEAVITITWYEPLSIPVLTGASYLKLTARQVVLCQSPPRPSPFP